MTKKEDKAWREGYEAGIKTAMNNNARAIRLGEAILAVLNEVYEFKEEDY